MPIRFHCARCGKSLSITTCKAGAPIACPLCHTAVTVPADPAPVEPPAPVPAGENAVPWYVEAQLPPPGPSPADAACQPRLGILVEEGVQTAAPAGSPPAAVAPALPPTLFGWRVPPNLFGWHVPGHPLTTAAAAVAVVLVGACAFLVALGILARTPEQPADTPVRQTQVTQARPAPGTGLSTGRPATVAVKPEPAVALPRQEKPAPKLETKPAAVKPQENTQPTATVKEPVKDRVEVARDKNADEVVEKQPPAEAKFQVKRRTHTTDEELRKQLLLAPELGLDSAPFATQTLLTKARQPGNRDKDLAPMLAMNSVNLVGLPFKMGDECRTGKEPAEHLQALSRKLRGHLEAAIPPAVNGVVTDPRPDPVILRQRLLGDAERDSWLQAEAIPALLQLLMAENKATRLVLVDVLEKIEGRDATRALAMRALVDLHADVRAAALRALRQRPRADYEQLFLSGLRYPWPAVADHAAEGIAALGMRDLAPRLVPMLDLPEPGAPFRMTLPNKKTMVVAREVVRVNHLGNCLLCHASSFDRADLVRGLVPTPGEALPAPVSTPRYYEGDRGVFVRADITYLKQDFSVSQPVTNNGPWPAHQRFDYLVRHRPVSAQEQAAYQARADFANPVYPQKEAVLFALRELTGQDRGDTAADWLKDPQLKLAKAASPREQAVRLSNDLVQAPADRQQELLVQYMVEEDTVYNLALARAIPQLPAAAQRKSREALTERLVRMPDDALREHLRSEDAEIRNAAIAASGRAAARALVPDLIDQLASADKETTPKLVRALQQITGGDYGPSANARIGERAAAVAAWRAWWEQHGKK
jgi:hypothetical protein